MDISLEALKRAVEIRKSIDTLQARLSSLLGAAYAGGTLPGDPIVDDPLDPEPLPQKPKPKPKKNRSI